MLENPVVPGMQTRQNPVPHAQHPINEHLDTLSAALAERMLARAGKNKLAKPISGGSDNPPNPNKPPGFRYVDDYGNEYTSEKEFDAFVRQNLKSVGWPEEYFQKMKEELLKRNKAK